MLTRSNKTQEKSSRAVSNEVHSKQNGHRASIEFEDTRPEALAQRKLQDMANNSPQLDQNRANQEMVNNSTNS
ncbi:MAG: hypothetical protein Q8S11_12315 [Daejeonella sp.]|nr:hypothetical protein [Daejeonella sp.]